MTSLTSLQLWLNKPEIDRRVQEPERQIGQIAHGEAGHGNRELHEFLVTLVTQLFDALVDLRLVQPELQRCHRSGLLRRGRRTRLRIGTPLSI